MPGATARSGSRQDPKHGFLITLQEPLSRGISLSRTFTWNQLIILWASSWCPELGTLQECADWFVRWTNEVAAGSAFVHMASVEEGLGRIMYVVGV